MYRNIKNYFLIFTIIFWAWSVSAQTRTDETTTTTTQDGINTDTTKETRTEITRDEPVVLKSENEMQAEKKRGGLYVEPGITYENMDTNINWPTPFSSSSGQVRGVGLMGRVGFHAGEAIFLAIDGRYVKPTFSDSSTNVDTNASLYDYGPTVGIQLPYKGMRLWGQYVMGGQLDSEAANGFDYKFDQSTGYRIGAGFHVGSVSLNLEYQDLGYRTNVQSALGFTADTTFESSDLTSKGVIASISFPLGL